MCYNTLKGLILGLHVESASRATLLNNLEYLAETARDGVVLTAGPTIPAFENSKNISAGSSAAESEKPSRTG